MNPIVRIKGGPLSAAVPDILVRAGPNAVFAAEEFFKATLNNPHTKRAYGRAVARFLAWFEQRGVEPRQITPGLAGEYVSGLAGTAPTNYATCELRISSIRRSKSARVLLASKLC
jgi:hypothetical protein